MKYEDKTRIYSDLNLLRYLRENSHYIKYFNRRGTFEEFDKAMKREYSITFKDKINKFQMGTNLLRAIMESSKEN